MPKLFDDEDIAEVLTSPAPLQLKLTELEVRLIQLAKSDADRRLTQELGVIIRGKGFNPDDGRQYTFVQQDSGEHVLHVNPATR